MRNLDHFKDREAAIAAFDRLWEDDRGWILAFTGFSGFGKSTLLDWLEEKRCREAEMSYALLGVGEYSANLRAFFHDLFDTPLRQKLPEHALQQYYSHYHDAVDSLKKRKVAFEAKQLMENAEQGNQSINLNLAKAVQEMENQANTSIFEAWLNCFEQLNSESKIVILLDNYDIFQDQIAVETLKQFWQLWRRAKSRVPALRVLIASREPIRHTNEIRLFQQGLIDSELEPLPEGDSDALLSSMGVTDVAFQEAVYKKLAHGHPLITNMAAEAWLDAEGTLTATDVPSLTTHAEAVNWVQGRILNRLEGANKEAVRWAALLRWFHAESLEAILGQSMTSDEFQAFSNRASIIRPRVNPKAWACHDLVRQVQMGYLQQERPEQFLHFHKRARDYFVENNQILDSLYHHFFIDPENAFEIWQKIEAEAAFNFNHTAWQAIIEIGLAPEHQLLPQQQAEIWHRAGRRHYYRAEWDEAIYFFDQALSRFNDIGDRLGQANVLMAIGDVQQFRKELDAALDSYNQALSRFNDIGDRLGQANVLKAIGDVQQFRDDRDAALDSYNQALSRFNDIGDRLGQANVLKAIGDVQQFRKELDAALDSYNQALSRFNDIGDRLG
ncbi:MAG: tetratricopeptide repeat protein, partial [Chloroflexota bacterium]